MRAESQAADVPPAADRNLLALYQRPQRLTDLTETEELQSCLFAFPLACLWAVLPLLKQARAPHPQRLHRHSHKERSAPARTPT